MDSLTSTKFDRMCRTCMACDPEETTNTTFELKPIDGFVDDFQSQKITIFDLVSNTNPLLPTIDMLDALPKTICTVCLQKMCSFYEFQQCCLSSDDHFRQLVAANSEDKNMLVDPLQGTKGNVNISELESFIKQEFEEDNGEEGKEIDENPFIVECTIEQNDSQSDLNDNDSDEVDLKPPVKKSSIEETNYETDEINKNNTTVVCEYCSKTYVSPKYLRRHLRRMHKDEIEKDSKSAEDDPNQMEDDDDKPKFTCNDCGSVFQKRVYLRKHKYRHNKPGGLKTYKKCEYCGITCKTVTMLRSHIRSTHPDQVEQKSSDPVKPYVCHFCNKGFQQSCTLKDHIRTHTGEMPFLCSLCGKAFNSNSNLQQHLLRHTGEKRYECPHCPKRFPCLSDLASHKQVHSKLRPHVCDICGSAFGKPYQLKKHKMHHSGEKPYQCEYCEMRFVCGDHMRRHMRTHTGEKPYKCKYCERSFTQSNDMIKHLRLHLGENVYLCELCPMAFRLATELREHFATHKNDDEETRRENQRALLEAQEKLKIKLHLDRAGRSFQR